MAALWPYSAAGDIAYASAANALSRLAKPSVDSVLKNTSSGTPSWLALTSIMAFASVYHNTTQNVSTGTPTALAFNSEYSDVLGWHSTVTNNSRITVDATGYYLAGCFIQYSAVGGSGTYWDTVDLRINGTAEAIDRRLRNVDAYSKMYANAFPIVPMTSGQYAEIYLEQNSGGTRTLTADVSFSLLRVG